MRLFQASQQRCYNQRPYQGSLGAALYAAAVDPASDPGPSAIEYRRGRILDGQIMPMGELYQLGADSVVKSPALAYADSPTAEITFDAEETWDGKTVWLNVRTHAADLENEQLWGARRLRVDDDSEPITNVEGTATLLAIEKRDAGGVLVRFAYTPSTHGVPPVQFVLHRTAGPTIPSDGLVLYEAEERIYELEISGLTDAGEYAFEVLAQNDTVETVLLDDLEFTADADGPPAVDDLTAVEI